MLACTFLWCSNDINYSLHLWFSWRILLLSLHMSVHMYMTHFLYLICFHDCNLLALNDLEHTCTLSFQMWACTLSVVAFSFLAHTYPCQIITVFSRKTLEIINPWLNQQQKSQTDEKGFKEHRTEKITSPSKFGNQIEKRVIQSIILQTRIKAQELISTKLTWTENQSIPLLP